MEYITINSDRSVTVPVELRKIGVQYDHNVNTIEFVGPRYSSNVDLSTMTIYINYILSDKTPGKYKAENVIIDDQDDSLIRFNWTITRNVTKASGILSCLVCAKKTDKEGNEINHWNTDIFRLLSVSEGMENDPVIQEQYPDVITSLIQNVEEHDTKLLEFSGLNNRVTDLENIIGELKGEIDNIHIPEQIQSDWTQNDESAPDYIKNKPFYDNSWVLDTSNVLKTNDINSDVGFVLVSNNPDDFYLSDNINYYGKYKNTEYKLTTPYYPTYDCNAFRYTDDDGNETTICYVVRQENTKIDIHNAGKRYEISNPSIGIWVKYDPQFGKKASIYTKDVHKIDEKYLPDLSQLYEEIADCIKSPASAEVGQIVKIAAVDDAGKPTVWEAVDLPEQVQPDWNQNDDTAADYVKNRPFYKETLESVPLYEMAVELSLRGDDIVPFYSTNEIHNKITSADKYLVRFDGVDYTCTAVKLNNGYGLGNLSLLNGANFARPDCVGSSEREDTGEPFCIIDDQYYTPSTWFYAQTDGDHIYAVHKIEEIIHQISGEFIPDLDGKINTPKNSDGTILNGISGQILQTNGDGTTQWVDKPPTVPDWAKHPEKPSYTAEEVGALPVGTNIPSKTSDLENDSGFTTLELDETLTDNTKAAPASMVGELKGDIGQLSEEMLTKVSVAYIVDDLTTNVSNKPLSAAQGVALKALIDAITIPDTLPNPNALTFTGAVTGSYDGSTSLSVNIPSAVTDDHINELINTALNAIGVAEEGVY